MTETSHRTLNYKIDHSTFGGIIYPSDYDTNHTGNGHSIASRIISDWNFDMQCRRNTESREKEKQYKEYKESNQNKENE